MLGLSQIITQLGDVVFPPLCVHCQREGTWLCTDGQAALFSSPPLIDPLCIDGVDSVWCAGSYDSPIIQRIVLGIKYHGWTAYTSLLPALFNRFSLLTPPDTVIIPIPLHARRQRSRGFNQALLVARALGGKTGVPVRPLLRRLRYTTPQATLHASARDTNLRNAFEVVGRLEKPALCGILVDDVITTGSTIRECASVPRHAGFQRLVAVALAKG